MIVNSDLENASFQVIDNSQEAALNSSIGRFYYNIESNQMLVGQGGTGNFKKVIISSKDSIGEIKTSMLTEAEFQIETDNTWVLAQGQSAFGTDYSAIRHARVQIQTTFVPNIVDAAIISPTVHPYLEAVDVGDTGIGLNIVTAWRDFDGMETLQEYVNDWNLNFGGRPFDLRVSAEDSAAPQFRNNYIPIAGDTTVTSQTYSKTLSIVVPDLRGVFLRGKNYMRSPSQLAGNIDLDVTLGQHQEESLKNHLHGITGKAHATTSTTSATAPVNHNNSPSNNTNTLLTGGTETRPNNVTVNYFMKVNRG